MKSIVSFFARQHMFVNLLTVFVIGYGVYTAFTTQVESFPNVDYDIVFISTIYPGASPREVERLLTTPIEDSLKSVSGMKKVYSYSIESSSFILIELETHLSNKSKVIRDIERAVDNVTDIPDDAEDPVITELNSKEFPIVQYTLSSTGDFRELRKYAKHLSETISNLKGVSSVGKEGYREREIIVNVNPRKLKKYYLSISQVIGALKSANISLPGGKIDDPANELMIRTSNEYAGVMDVKRTVVRSNADGNAIRVSEIAQVRDDYKDESIRYRANGGESITLTCVKKEGFDSIKVVAQIEKEIEAFKKTMPGHMTINKFNDMSYYTKRRLKVLVNNGIIGLFGIIIIMLIFLNPMTALMASIGIPFSLFSAIILFNHFGVTINLISMVGLIMVLGMLVDDAVVVAENIAYYLERGKSAIDAAITGAYEVIFPVFGSVMTTILAFFPLMFIDGITGKFIWAIPFAIIVTLFMSLFESLFVLPGHLSYTGGWTKVKPNRYIVPFENAYRKMICYNLNHKKYVLGGIFILVIATIVIATTQMKVILFPGAGVKMFIVKFQLPAGSSLDKTSEKGKEIEKIISELPKTEIEAYTTKIGTTSFNQFDPHGKDGSEYGLISALLTNEADRDRDAEEIKAEMREKVKTLEGFKDISIEGMQHGPPQGKAVEVGVIGDDYPTLNKIAEEIKTFLKDVEGVSGIESDYQKGKPEIIARINQDKAAASGVDPTAASIAVRSAFEGLEATSIKAVDEEIKIRVRYPETFRKSSENLKDLEILNQWGKLIPMKLFTEFEQVTSARSIRHKENLRTVTVTADVDAKKSSSVKVNLMLQEKFSNLAETYPGYRLDFAGEFESTKESFQSILKALVIALILVFFSLAVTSNSLMSPFVIMLSIPFGIIGVVWAFYTHGYPVSFIGMIGMVGMAGVVVNNSIVLSNIIERNIKSGMSLYDAIVEGCVRRLRAVMLTTITTLIGLFPTAYGIGGKEEFIQPMVLALAWGMVFGALLTLGLFPVNFYLSKKVSGYLSGKILRKGAVAALLAGALLFPASAFSAKIPLTLESYVKKITQKNFDYKMIRENRSISTHAWRGIYAMYDIYFEGNTSMFLDNKNPLSTFSVQDLKTGGYDLKLSKKFTFGTILETGFKQNFSFYDQMEMSASLLTFSNTSKRYIESNLFFNIVQPLLRNFFGRADRIKIDSFKNQEMSAHHDLKRGASSLIMGGITLYFNWLLAVKSLETQKQSLEYSRNLLKENLAKFKRKLLEDSDIVKTRLLVETRKNDLLAAEHTLQKIETDLLKFVGEENNGFSPPQNPEFKIGTPGNSPDFMISKALSERDDIKALENRLRASTLSVKNLSLDLLPELNLVLKYETTGNEEKYSDSLKNAFTFSKYPTFFAGLGLKYNLESSDVRNSLKKEKAEKNINILLLQKLKLDVSSSIRKAFHQLITNEKKYRNANSIYDLQVKKMKLEEKLFKYGRSNINNIIDFTNDLTLSGLLKSKAYIEYCISYYELLHERNMLLAEFRME